MPWQVPSRSLWVQGPQRCLDKKFGAPTITHDGVTVAKEIELEEPFQNMGAQLLKEAATKTNDVAATARPPLLCWPDHCHRRAENVAAGANRC